MHLVESDAYLLMVGRGKPDPATYNFDIDMCIDRALVNWNVDSEPVCIVVRNKVGDPKATILRDSIEPQVAHCLYADGAVQHFRCTAIKRPGDAHWVTQVVTVTREGLNIGSPYVVD